MAREHLYKAKRKDNGEWVYWNVFGIIVDPISMNSCPIRIVHNAGTPKEWVQTMVSRISLVDIDENTICKYTGLKDKNGTKIFRGDVVKTKHGRLCEVSWLTVPSFCGYDLIPLESKHLCPTWYDLYSSCNLEVIGNKFDNPELLEV